MTRELVPDSIRHLLDRPLIGLLGTIRPDDTVQVHPMWFEFDGEHIRFTHTTKRQKFRNLQHSTAMSLAVVDPDNPYSYIEVAGRLVETIPDPDGSMYVRLQKRYGAADLTPPADTSDRVILVMSIERSTYQ